MAQARTVQFWEFAFDGVWTRYSDDVQTHIRQAYEAKHPTVEVTPSHILDFAQFRQLNKDDCNRWRGVRAVPVTVSEETPALRQGSDLALAGNAPGAAEVVIRRTHQDCCDLGIFEQCMQMLQGRQLTAA